MKNQIIIIFYISILLLSGSCSDHDLPPFEYEEITPPNPIFPARPGIGLYNSWGVYCGGLENDFLPPHNFVNGEAAPEKYNFRFISINLADKCFEDWLFVDEHPEGLLYTKGSVKVLDRDKYLFISDDDPLLQTEVTHLYNPDNNTGNYLSSIYSNGDSTKIEPFNVYTNTFVSNFDRQFRDVRGEVKGENRFYSHYYDVSSILDVFIDNGNGLFNESLRSTLPESTFGYGFYSSFDFSEETPFDNYLILQAFEFINLGSDSRKRMIYADMIWYFKINSVHDGMMELTQYTALDGYSIGKARIIFPDEPIEPLLPY